MDLDLEQLADAPYQKKQAASPNERSPTDQEQTHQRASSRSRGHSSSRYRESSRQSDRRDRRDSRDRSRDHGNSRDHHSSSRRSDDRNRDHDRRRSRSPRSRHHRDDYDDSYDRRRRARSPPIRERTPELTEAERDQRTVFVQQLAARLRTKELIAFFEKAGPVRDAQIVKDRISGRSKGVGYVEFKSAETVPTALALTGQLLLGLPIIAQLTEAEKNRQAREGLASTAAASHHANAAPVPDTPFHRLYVGNIHFNIGEDDLRAVFEPFGELQHVALQIDNETGRSRGYGFVQFKDAAHAREALETMHGFELAGRAIRVGFGNEHVKVGTDAASTAAMARAASAALAPAQGKFTSNDFGGERGREVRERDRDQRDGGRDREGRRGPRETLEESRGGGGGGYHAISRTELMRKLARAEDGIHAQPAPASVDPASKLSVSRGLLLKNMFNPAEESGTTWTTELAEDVKAECEEKYGEVVHIHVEEHSLGEIYVKFKTLEGGKKAMEGLNGRWFGGRTIGASPLLDAIYQTKFPESKQL